MVWSDICYLSASPVSVRYMGFIVFGIIPLCIVSVVKITIYQARTLVKIARRKFNFLFCILIIIEHLKELYVIFWHVLLILIFVISKFCMSYFKEVFRYLEIHLLILLTNFRWKLPHCQSSSSYEIAHEASARVEGFFIIEIFFGLVVNGLKLLCQVVKLVLMVTFNLSIAVLATICN